MRWLTRTRILIGRVRPDPVTASIWGVGLLIRLALLPLTFHSDLYHVYSRAHTAIATGAWFAWNAQLVAQWFHNLWFLCIVRLLPGSESIWSDTAGIAGLGAQPDDLARFLTYPYLARTLVLLKLPYVAADALVGWLLGRSASTDERRWIVALWWLNPIVIYTSAVFGRHDSVWVAILVLGSFAARRGARWTGLICSAIAAIARFFPVFVLPLYLVSFRRSWRGVVAVAVAVAGLWAAVDLALTARSGVSPTLTLLGDYPHVRYLVALGLPVSGDSPVPVFPLAYTLFLSWWLTTAPRGWEAYRGGAAATLCAMVALTPFHPQYVIWALPFALDVLARQRAGRLLAVLQAGLFLAWLTRWGAAATTELFAPLGETVVSRLPDPQLAAAALVPATVWQPALRAVFTGVTLWIGWLALRESRPVGEPVSPRELVGRER
ncbi:MAG: hypothetical protein RMH81_00340 [Thermomicrobium sp.]|nr:hypothetical protein [Thermomicrobium sp.]